ncbi:hypothetical protein TNCV_3908991 [Trichonephila clavipes]|nr:hypothetical protein TNCV_3908991 [Trichonephila clavipes]
MSQSEAAQEILVMSVVTLNLGQVKGAIPEPAFPLKTSTPYQRRTLSHDRFNVHKQLCEYSAGDGLSIGLMEQPPRGPDNLDLTGSKSFSLDPAMPRGKVSRTPLATEPNNSEPLSRDEDATPRHTTPTGEMSHDRFNMHRLLYTASLQWRWNSNPQLDKADLELSTLTTQLPRPVKFGKDGDRRLPKIPRMSRGHSPNCKVPSQDLLAASKWREGVPGWSGRCTSEVYTPGRVTVDVKAIPLCPVKVRRH